METDSIRKMTEANKPFTVGASNDWLMAVLNNPAITLTPVDAVSSATKSRTSVNPISWAELKRRNETKLIRVNSEQSHRDSRLNTSVQSQGSSYINASNHIEPPVSNRNTVRIPKSVVNLLATGPTVSPVNEAQQSMTPHVDMNRAPNQSVPDNRVALGWLSVIALSTMKDVDNSVTLSWVPGKNAQNDQLATSDLVRSQSEQAGKQSERTTQTLSVQMLHQFANQTDSNESQDSNSSSAVKSPTFEPDCIPTMSRVNVQQLDKGARSQEVVYTVCIDGDLPKKSDKAPIRGTKHRLYLPRHEQGVPRKKLCTFPSIHIEAIQQKEVLVSERHLMLEKMVEIAETVGQRKQAPIEPDDVLVNRSKRIMSRIDTVVEKKKRRRFERICHRSSPNSIESCDQSEVSDDESIIEENVDLVDSVVVPIQLPLDEALTDQKREYLSNFGLISRSDKNKLSMQECVKRLNSISTLALQETGVVSEDIRRFIDTIVQTGGTDVQMRTETNIKRNELPFIEGLNRNTSRIKMSYMSALGLDKRSKRTTLYKVAKSQEKSGKQTLAQQQNDLTKKQHTKIPINNLTKLSQSVTQHIVKPDVQNDKNKVKVDPNLFAKVVQLCKSSCREAVQVPKDEYMRSLGLMAS